MTWNIFNLANQMFEDIVGDLKEQSILKDKIRAQVDLLDEICKDSESYVQLLHLKTTTDCTTP